MVDAEDAELIYRVALRRSFASANPGLVQLHFEIGVLDRYRDAPGFAIMRTNTVARLKKEGGWALNFGIGPDEETVHASLGELQRLPEAEREHWTSFAMLLPSSRMFISMQLAPGACYDDGEVRPWK